MHLNGVPIITSMHLTVPYEDWSEVRSPSRARRRMHKHRQRIRYLQKPDPNVYQIAGALHMHPVTMHRLNAELRKDAA